LFSIIPAGAAGCIGCARTVCAQVPPPSSAHNWSEKADITWEEIFRFAYQKDLIPLLNQLAEHIGREEFVAMLRQASDEVVRKKTAGRAPVVPDLVALAGNLNRMPPLMQHALDVEIVERSAEAFEYRVKKCLWAKVFRDSNAADIGYGMVCYPDYAVARGLNPRLKLIRTKTLMQGDAECSLRYVMET
jgi:hypothetical protein